MVMGGISPPGDCLSSSDNSRAGSIPHTPDKSRRGGAALSFLEGLWPVTPADIAKTSASVAGTPKEWFRISVISSYPSFGSLIGEVQFAAIVEDDLRAGVARSGIRHRLAIFGGTDNDRD